MITLRVALNGTDENPFHHMGLTQNPFPQLGRYEYDRQCLHLAALGGEPIPDADHIRKHLAGWEPEFVELCCERFRKGVYVTFDVEWPE
jgi:hypothetical protein